MTAWNVISMYFLISTKSRGEKRHIASSENALVFTCIYLMSMGYNGHTVDLHEYEWKLMQTGTDCSSTYSLLFQLSRQALM